MMYQSALARRILIILDFSPSAVMKQKGKKLEWTKKKCSQTTSQTQTVCKLHHRLCIYLGVCLNLCF